MTAHRSCPAILQCLLIIGAVTSNGFAQQEPKDSPTRARRPHDAEARQRQMLEDFVIRTANENDAEYTRIFSELGLKPEDQKRFKSQLEELHRKAIAAGEPMARLLEARLAYDKEVRAALGEENYQRYRDFEESKPAKREYELLQEFALKSKNLKIDDAFSEKIVRLFKETKATTTESWHGPYDPRPRPEVGQAAVLMSLTRRASEFRQASSNLVQVLPKSGLPDEYQRLLKATALKRSPRRRVKLLNSAFRRRYSENVGGRKWREGLKSCGRSTSPG